MPDCAIKDWVGMILCPICRKAYEIALDRRMKKSLCRETIDPGRVCDECWKTHLDGKGVMLINPTTGELYVLTDEGYNRIIVGVPIPKGRIVFMDDEATRNLRQMAQNIKEE